MIREGKQVVILAGGKGTRLGSAGANCPKPLVKLGNRSLLERQLDLAAEYRLTSVHLLIHHLGEQIVDAIGNGERWGFPITYHTETRPRGTAGSVVDVLPNLADTFFVLYGDTLLNVDLERMWEFHRERGADATLLIHPNDHPFDSDLVEIDADSWLRKFHRRDRSSSEFHANLVNAALYVVEKRCFDLVDVGDKRSDFARDFFPAALLRGAKLFGYRSREYIKDMGTPERLAEGSLDLASGRVDALLYRNAVPAVFLDRDGTLNEEVGRVADAAQLELIGGAADGVRQINAAAMLAVVVTNQAVVARGDCTFGGLAAIHNKLESLLGEQGAYLDGIYTCPHHPDRGFDGEVTHLKGECACRKPATGLIEQATRELNIDLSRSWLVGDTTTDLATAAAAGVKSILVRTGYGGCDYRHVLRTDFEFFDLAEAARFIAHDYEHELQRARALVNGCDAGALIAVGGLARAGKSNWASILREALRLQGKRAHVISLDSWLLPAADRTTAGVRNRFDVDEIVRLVHRLHNRRDSLTITLPFYDRLQRRPIERTPAALQIEPCDMVILEGVIALAIRQIVELSATKHYVDCPKDVHRERFEREYRVRGLTAAEVDELYTAREADEHALVEATKLAADVIVRMSGKEALDDSPGGVDGTQHRNILEFNATSSPLRAR